MQRKLQRIKWTKVRHVRILFLHSMTRHAPLATRTIEITEIWWKEGLEGLAEEEEEAFRLHPLYVGRAAEDAGHSVGDGAAEGDNEGACKQVARRAPGDQG